jgi:alkaline phosphatase D
VTGVTFPSGVASGDPTSEGAVVWTRAIGRPPEDPVHLTLCVREDGSERLVHRKELTTDPSACQTAKATVGGLEPGRRYLFEFTGGESSVGGSFKTLSDAQEVWRIGVVTCAKYNAGFFNAYRALAQIDVDLVVHLGDYIYETAEHPLGAQTPGAGIGRELDPPTECLSVSDYRARYEQARSDPDLQAFHAAHAVVATIDDHEIADNCWAGGADEHVPERDGPWEERFGAALRAWTEWVPSRRDPMSGTPVWTAVTLPGAGELLILETRSERYPPGRRPDRPRGQLIGDAQRAFIAERLRLADGAVVVFSPSVVGQLWAPSLSEDSLWALRKLKLAEASGRPRPFHDLWDAFPHEREWLLALLESNTAADPVIVSGDVHIALSGRATIDSAIREWTVSSITSMNLDDKMGWEPRAASSKYEAAFLCDSPRLAHCDFDSHGFLIVSVSEGTIDGEWYSVDTVRSRNANASVRHRETVARRSAALPRR